MELYQKWFNKLAIIILGMGDLDAYIFDWEALSEVQKKDFLKTHLYKLDERFTKKAKNWTDTWRPFALLGFSMPPSIIGDVESGEIKLDPGHIDGVLFISTEADGVFYCGSDVPDKLAILKPEIEGLQIHDYAGKDMEFPVKDINFDYKVQTEESKGNVLEEMEPLMKMAGLPGVQFI